VPPKTSLFCSKYFVLSHKSMKHLLGTNIELGEWQNTLAYYVSKKFYSVTSVHGEQLDLHQVMVENVLAENFGFFSFFGQCFKHFLEVSRIFELPEWSEFWIWPMLSDHSQVCWNSDKKYVCKYIKISLVVTFYW
jgi:hypothetical protein